MEENKGPLRSNKPKILVDLMMHTECNLLCDYCISNLKRLVGQSLEISWTMDQYKYFRDTRFDPRKEVYVQAIMGEPSYGRNAELTLSWFKALDKEKIQFITNGLGSREYYEQIVEMKDKFIEVGFSFHRKMLNDDNKKKWLSNLEYLRSAGLPVYASEVFFNSTREESLRDLKYYSEREWTYALIPYKDAFNKVLEVYSEEDQKLFESTWKNHCSLPESVRHIVIHWNGVVFDYQGNQYGCLGEKRKDVNKSV